MAEYTAAQKLEAVERELKYRKRVYPKWIAQGKISASFASFQEAIFAEIAEDYREQADDEDLFKR